MKAPLVRNKRFIRIGSNSTLCTLNKEIWEGNLQSVLCDDLFLVHSELYLLLYYAQLYFLIVTFLKLIKSHHILISLEMLGS